MYRVPGVLLVPHDAPDGAWSATDGVVSIPDTILSVPVGQSGPVKVRDIMKLKQGG